MNPFKSYSYSCNEEKTFEFIFPRQKEETKIVTFGDWSDCANGKASLNYLLKNIEKYDSAIILGDLAYDLYTDNGKMGNNFMEFIYAFTTKIPFMNTAGNHETKNHYEDYIERFNLPLKKENKNLFYSFDINDAHFVTLPSDFAIGENKTAKEEIEKMLTWLERDLKATNKKWKIVYMHRPLYCSDYSKETCTKESEELRNTFEDLFYQNKVDLVLAGHLHNYERLMPVYNAEADLKATEENENVYDSPKFPVYLICGAVGNSNGEHKKCILF